MNEVLSLQHINDLRNLDRLKYYIPIGTIIEELKWTHSICWIKASKTEYLKCDGQKVDRIKYPTLYKKYKYAPNFNIKVEIIDDR